MSKEKIKKNLRILLEKANDTYSYGCVMLYFNVSKKQWNEFQSMIDDEDIYTEEGDNTYGREDEPHVTILYGLHADIPDSDIESLIDTIKPPKLTLKKISIFDNSDDYDVVKFDIIGDSETKLGKMNAKFVELPHTTNYPDYHPHSTIAYVKAGTGEKYVKTLSDDEAISIIPNQVVYSKADGTKNKYKLK
jgi:2'-5' RNA ligase